MRVLVVGWASFVEGEATAGDVLSMTVVAERVAAAGLDCDVAWSPVLRPGALSLAAARPESYTHLVFACGPAHGWQVARLHERYRRCRRIAVGVSVIDPDEPAVTGFDAVLPRDGTGPTHPDLAALATVRRVPVVGVVLAPAQPEYARGRHDAVGASVTGWVNDRECAPVPCDTRLDAGDWRHCGTADELVSLIRRMDLVVTTRLHGMVLAVRYGVPALAVDPVEGGAKVAAQARALGWPACLTAGELSEQGWDRWWRWCLSEPGRTAAADLAARGVPDEQLGRLLDELATSGAPR